MPVDIEQLLTDALAQVRNGREKDELDQRFAKLEEKRNLSMSDILTALEGASDEELDALQGTVLGGLAKKVEDERNDDDDDVADAAGVAGNGKKKKTPKPRTRPGRKSGNAYDWWVDDETGEVVKLDVARIYSGEDEDDEVNIPIRDSESDDDE